MLFDPPWDSFKSVIINTLPSLEVMGRVPSEPKEVFEGGSPLLHTNAVLQMTIGRPMMRSTQSIVQTWENDNKLSWITMIRCPQQVVN